MEVSCEMSSPLLNLPSISNTVRSMLSMSDFTLQAANRHISTKANQHLDLYSKFSIVSTIKQLTSSNYHFNNATIQQLLPRRFPTILGLILQFDVTETQCKTCTHTRRIVSRCF